jgi:hypothetical protein
MVCTMAQFLAVPRYNTVTEKYRCSRSANLLADAIINQCYIIVNMCSTDNIFLKEINRDNLPYLLDIKTAL